jgi:hypothetical protein
MLPAHQRRAPRTANPHVEIEHQVSFGLGWGMACPRVGADPTATQGRRVRWVAMVRVLRGIAAVLLSLLASVLLTVSLVLCITVVLLPLGVPLLMVSIWLFKQGMRLLLPRKRDVQRSVRKALRIPKLRKAVHKGRRRAGRMAGRLRERSARLVHGAR